jgi:hypothetical protein
MYSTDIRIWTSQKIFLAAEFQRRGGFPQQDSAVRAFNKLARTFAAQVETLKRYRGGGGQVQVGSILRRAALR